MIIDYIHSNEYVIILYLVHIVISLVLAFILAKYTSKRFQKDSAKIALVDKKRLEEIKNKKIIFKLFFQFSLHKYNYLTNVLFIFMLNLSLPVIGYIISIWISWYLENIVYEDKVSHTSILNLDEFGISFLKVERIFGEGSMGDLMTSEYAPKSKKLRALSSLANNISPVNLKIIRQTLTSTDDEIRMFGYAIINKAEKALNVKINTQLDIFHEAEKFLSKYSDNSEKKEYKKYVIQRAESARNLAPLYWEMIYTELSHESLKENFLNEVVKYLKIAKEHYLPLLHTVEGNADSTDLKELVARLFILMGRVYMLECKYEKASTEFTIAREINDAEYTSVLPYLAEINFVEGRYHIVQSILNSSKDLGLNSTLYHVVEQWREIA